MDIGDINSFIQAAKGALDVVKSSIGLLPKGPDRDAAQRQLETAERTVRTAEVKLAQSLGYHLCQCTFPPQIMLSIGRHPQRGDEMFKCANCGKQEPSEKHFKDMEDADAYNRRLESDFGLDGRY